MKKLIVTTLAMAMTLGVTAQETIALPAPDKALSMTLMEALQQRHSTWEHPDKPLTDVELSTVLWAASGINRPEEKRITAPSAVNAQDIVVYALRADGTYMYNVEKHQLDKVNNKDLREAACGRDPKPKVAPVILLLVSDLNKFGGDSDFARAMAPLDAGYVSENICLVCTALGLNTVPRMTMNQRVLKEELGLSDIQLPLLNHPISKP